jgi:hypothetical protein
MNKTPLQIIEHLIDQFYAVEDQFAQSLGVAPVDIRTNTYNLNRYTYAGQLEEELEQKFQAIYNDLSNLMWEIKDLEEK